MLRPRSLLRLLPVLLSVLGVALLLSRLDWERARTTLLAADGGLVLLSIALAVALQVVSGARWWVLLAYRASFRTACLSLFAGNFTNTLTPLRMGDVLRVLLVQRRHELALSTGLSAVLLGHALDVASLLVLGLLAALLAPIPPALVQGGFLLAAVIGGGLLVGALVVRLARGITLENRLWLRLRGLLANVGEGFRSVQEGRSLLAVVGFSLLFWFGVAFNNWLLLKALVPDVPLSLGLLIGFAAGIGQLLPALPGSIGTLDAAVALSLSLTGMDDNTALAFVLLLRLRYVVMFGLPGVLAFALESVPMSDALRLKATRKPPDAP